MSKPGLLLPPPLPLRRGVQPRARPRPGRERRWVGAERRGTRAARSGFGRGHRGRSPPPSRRSPALPGRGAGGGRGAARGFGVLGALPRLGQRPRGPHRLPRQPPPAHGPGAERPRGPRRDWRAGGRERRPRSGLTPRRSRIGRAEAPDRLSRLRDQRQRGSRVLGGGRVARSLPPGLGQSALPCPSAGELAPALNLYRDRARRRLGNLFRHPAGASRLRVCPSPL